MALTGSFKETSFADLLQLYSISRQTASVTVFRGEPGGRADGLFWFDSGELVGAALDGVEGREAVRRVLRLTDGRFSVAPGAKLAPSAVRADLRQVVMEEVVAVDEQNQASATGERPAQPRPAQAAGGPTPPPRPPPTKGSSGSLPLPSPGGGRTPGAIGGAGGGGGPKKPATPARGGKALMLGMLAVGVVLLSGITWFALSQGKGTQGPAAQQARLPSAPGVRGVSADEIRLGMATALTGADKDRGRAVRTGWEAALAAANAAGGINGRKLKLVTVDDGYDPLRTGPALKQLVEADGVFALVGNADTATSAVVVPFCTEQKLVFFGSLSGADVQGKDGPDRYVFNYRASLAQEAAAAVRYLADVKRVPPERIAVLLQHDEFGEAGWRGAVKQLETYGVGSGAVVRLEYHRNTADVREALEKLKERSAAVQAVVLVATYKPAATFIRKAKDAALELLFVAVSADSNALAQELVEAGAHGTEGVVLTQVVPVPTSRAAAVQRYRKVLEQFAAGEAPGSTTLEAWIGAQLFLEGLKRAGPQLDGERVVEALESVRDFDVGTGAIMSFDPKQHQASHKVWGWSLQPDGTYQQIDLE